MLPANSHQAAEKRDFQERVGPAAGGESEEFEVASGSRKLLRRRFIVQAARAD
jgi:hypothetical protein